MTEQNIQNGVDAFSTRVTDPEMEEDRMIKVNALKGLLTRSKELGIREIELRQGEWILHEGKSNDRLYIILEGEAELLKLAASDQNIQVDKLKAGNFLGLISFWTHRKSFSSSRAVTELKCAYMERERFKKLMDEDREFNRIMQNLIISNLTQRYRRMALLNVEVARLTHDLESERNSLKSTILDLELTRNRLVHQEKLATMGQLVAGIAHEINNPSSALIKSVNTLQSAIPKLFDHNGPLFSYKLEKKLLEQGLICPYYGTNVIRKRIDTFQERFPHLKRSMARRLSQLNDDCLPLVESVLLEADNKNLWHELDSLLSFFEIGIYLRGIDSSVERITGLVQSLKNYGRVDSLELHDVDLLTCIEDTLVVLNHRLKQYHLSLKCKSLPKVSCHPGEINQVLTNLLVNACEATDAGEGIVVKNGYDEQEVWVSVSDRGCGIPEALIDTIFHTNVTTKNRSGEFGLGLGLSISKDIINKHGGRIVARNRKSGGACFIFHLPISKN